tara:strand:- start:5547 stop:5837 length:291 start_codon:yes stop_codon:yes gene_type:complete
MGREIHYWIKADRADGRTFLVYGGLTETEATQKALNIKDLPAYFDVIQLPTRDQGRASSLLKGKKLEESGSLGDSTQNLSHTLHQRGKNGFSADSP